MADTKLRIRRKTRKANNFHGNVTQHAQCAYQTLLICVYRYGSIYKQQCMSFALFTNAGVLYGCR
ncbi:hypothetical protein KIN20_020781 [Parelaphostrongylus tenuis]|uniref:Uncharacterized protein n=1 Tax=Parelaphostrongylus tenuis TaxID=148309 RepID=A0AAD5MRR7_PARTN|nr:hypothetical protein KIN20_020781 [Parelaphostrongylus tenuis]